ncbi:MAG: SpoIIE family protein phosphatase [Actinomycetota bacterium]
MTEAEANLRRPGEDWREPAWDALEIITSSSADGITIQDATGKLIYANDAAARMSGFASGEAMHGASVDEIVERFELLDEAGRTLSVGELPGRRALAGEREPEAVVRFRTHPNEDERWALVRATPLFDGRGQVRHVVNVFVDITADRARRQVQSFLADATKQLARSLDWEATIRRVARLAVPVMADWCAVDVVEPDGSLSLIAIAHVDPAKVEWAQELRRRFPPEVGDTSGVAHVVRTGVSELVPAVTRELIEAANITDPELLDVVGRLNLSSVMYIPLTARGRTLGALTMVWAESGKHYSEEDLVLGEDLASRAAFAIDNARLYRERDHAARSLQERLLPKTLPQIPGVDVAARYLPAGDVLQAGGDFYDLFEMDDGSWKAVIGDVCGKGPEAAALMGFVRFTTRAVSRQDTKPSEALVKLNKALLEELEAGKGEFCTAAVVRIRPYDQGVRLTVAVGGHPLPLIVRVNGGVEEAGVPGTLLGIFEDIVISDQVVDLHPGDALVMLTDGVLEASRAQGWESRTIPRMLADAAGESPDAIADRITAAVSALDERRTDDVAVLVLRCRD